MAVVLVKGPAPRAAQEMYACLVLDCDVGQAAEVRVLHVMAVGASAAVPLGRSSTTRAEALEPREFVALTAALA